MGEQVEKPPEEKKPEEAPAKSDEKKPPEESKDTPPPPPPPPEIVLRVFMHCEGCARKVRRCLKGFDGVEDVLTDCKTHKVVVKGEKADPLKVLERVQKKSHRTVELLSPVAKSPAGEGKVEEKEAPKPEEKQEEPPQVITVMVKVNMHCEACAQVIKKRIMRMKGVESAETDLKNSQVTVKGTFEPLQLVDYIHKRTGKQAVVVKQDPEPKKEDEMSKEDRKDAGDKKKEEKTAGDTAGDGKENEKDKEKDQKKEEKKTSGGGDEPADGGPAGGGGGEVAGGGDSGGGGGGDVTVVELRKNEFYYYHPANYQIYPSRYTAEWAYGYPPAPQMFSDENPNACTVM